MKVSNRKGFVGSDFSSSVLSYVSCCTADIASKLGRAKIALKQAKERLDSVSTQSRERKLLEAREDEMSSSLRRWFLRVRSLVLLPSQTSLAEAARPAFGMLLSPPMVDVVKDACLLGISDLPDVQVMINCFKCLSWSLSSLEVINRKPSLHEISTLVSMVTNVRLPDEKALKTMKFMLSRATHVQSRIMKALIPKPGETKSISVPFLMEIEASANELPLIVPEKRSLRIAIDDNGTRHCVCGGPRDGLMLLCGACDKWFHGTCMEESIDCEAPFRNWMCRSCRGNRSTTDITSDEFCSKEPLLKLHETCCYRDISPHAPDPMKLWPPFGILGSDAALEVLGKECSAIPDETCSLEISQVSRTTNSEGHSGNSIVTPSPASVVPNGKHIAGLQDTVISSQSCCSRPPNEIHVAQSSAGSVENPLDVRKPTGFSRAENTLQCSSSGTLLINYQTSS
jgi:PHD-finger